MGLSMSWFIGNWLICRLGLVYRELWKKLEKGNVFISVELSIIVTKMHEKVKSEEICVTL